MSSEKRRASDSFGSNALVVKRPDRGDGKAVALSSRGAGNGALIQAVRTIWAVVKTALTTDLKLMASTATADKWARSTGDGTVRSFWRSLHS